MNISLKIVGLCSLTVAAGAMAGVAYSTRPEVEETVTVDESSLISSDADGALRPPGEWTCELYVKEFEEFLDSGNTPSEWRFAGKVYRQPGTVLQYTWMDWLRWVKSNDCALGPATQSEAAQLVVVPSAAKLIGAIVGGSTATALAAGNAGSTDATSEFDSPG